MSEGGYYSKNYWLYSQLDLDLKWRLVRPLLVFFRLFFLVPDLQFHLDGSLEKEHIMDP